MIVQILASTLARTIYSTNLPDGMYRMKLIDMIYQDTSGVNQYLVKVSSDTFRIPYGTNANQLLFTSLSKNGTRSPVGEYRFLAVISQGNVDLTITLPPANQASFTEMVLTFDVMPTSVLNLFYD